MISLTPTQIPAHTTGLQQPKMSTTTTFPLLSLPLELRLQIYSHVLSDFALEMRRSGSLRSSGHNAVGPYHPLSYRALSLLFVCHQLHAETLPVLHRVPKPLAFRIHFIERLSTLPSVPAAFASSIRVVIFPSRSGSRRLLEALPHLRAVGVCRNALTRSPDLVWLGAGSLEALRTWMVGFVQAERFVGSLCQQWLLHYLYRSPGRAKVWCRVVATRSQSFMVEEEAEGQEERGREYVVKQAVWVDLDERERPECWRWCVPTRHEVRSVAGWQAARYNPPLETEASDEGLGMIVKWWCPQEGVTADGEGHLGHGTGGSKSVPFCWQGTRVYA